MEHDFVTIFSVYLTFWYSIFLSVKFLILLEQDSRPIKILGITVVSEACEKLELLAQNDCLLNCL